MADESSEDRHVEPYRRALVRGAIAVALTSAIAACVAALIETSRADELTGSPTAFLLRFAAGAAFASIGLFLFERRELGRRLAAAEPLPGLFSRRPASSISWLGVPVGGLLLGLAIVGLDHLLGPDAHTLGGILAVSVGPAIERGVFMNLLIARQEGARQSQLFIAGDEDAEEPSLYWGSDPSASTAALQ